MKTIKEMMACKLKVKVYENRTDMGKVAASEMSEVLRRLLTEKNVVSIIFASAPSQNEFLAALSDLEDIDWGKVNAFHMDEYIGLDEDAPQGFGNFLKGKIFGKVPFKTVNYIDGNASDPEKEGIRYAALLKRYPADIVCMGIGENGHVAFNEPHVSRFDDSVMVKLVKLDDRSRAQQVHDGCFSSINEVPSEALTLTIPALVSAKYIFCMVPGSSKAQAVARAIYGEVDESCPASVLKTHECAVLYIDKDSAAGLKEA